MSNEHDASQAESGKGNPRPLTLPRCFSGFTLLDRRVWTVQWQQREVLPYV